MFTYIEMVFTEENICTIRYVIMIPPRKLQPLLAHFDILWNVKLRIVTTNSFSGIFIDVFLHFGTAHNL